MKRVALRKESVDRNIIINTRICNQIVALRKESVDRNIIGSNNKLCNLWSLSARRAWIEIKSPCSSFFKSFWSLSARRAWIEMPKDCKASGPNQSLSARRAWIEI